MYNIIEKSWFWAIISLASTVISAILLLVWGLNLGIDFTGGTSVQLHFPDSASRPSTEEVSKTVFDQGIKEVRVQTAGDSDLVLKMPYIENAQKQQILDVWKETGVEEVNSYSIGPSLGNELKKKAMTAIILVLLAIVAYISYAFRKVSIGPVPSWVYGIAAIIALAHDILLVVGIFVILGHFYDIQIDTLFVTALLTILGFSVHDTIVVYDRLRERLKKKEGKSFKEVINESINTTLARSLNTSLTTILVLGALYLFGGASIQYFVLALIIGIIFGTYSSIFIASPLLLLGEKLLKRHS
ncbi:MAG TPA: protein translocase subunit SecF [Patescibacteria group bacterium]|nr:protein translocase subunit SecF [Patescibacteria group bacterium]